MAGRDPAESGRASTPLELLFDLTFVVAVAVAAAELHHALAEGSAAHAVTGYLTVFFGIWWAWVNFTWFASAYDTDDVPYRILTLVQIGGVLVFAAGIPAAFDRFDFTIVVIGYMVMRLVLVTQWLRAAREHPDGRSGTLRYAVGVALVQAAWIGRLWLPGLAGWIGFAVLVAAELAVPVWAEFSGQATSWHPGHITERYGLFTIIVLGEVISAIAIAVQSALAGGGMLTPNLLAAAAAGLLLVFVLWWSYFKHPVTTQLRQQTLPRTFVWAFGHYLIFAAVAALGAGLQVVVDTLAHSAHVTAVFAAFTVAIPVAVFLIVLGLLNTRTSSEPVASGPILLTAVLVLAAAEGARILPLSLSIVILVVLVALLLAYHLAAAHQTTRRPGPGPA
jgi:low temperature requirement protein LtrA